MNYFKSIRRNLFQISAITEKSIKLRTRFKLNLVLSFISPIIGIILPIIIMNQFFIFNNQFGLWTQNNFLIYQFIAYDIGLLRGMISIYPSGFHREKYWQTLPAIILAPFNRINLLFGFFIAQIIMISIPFTIFFVVCYVYYPISIFTILFIILIYFLIALVFSGIGIILGIFAISKEGYLGFIKFMLSFFFMFSCISYPFQIFPELIQNFINLNPLYYIFDILRLTWVEDNILLSITSHSFHFFILTIGAIGLPLIGVYIFNIIYKKYGIVGY